MAGGVGAGGGGEALPAFGAWGGSAGAAAAVSGVAAVAAGVTPVAGFEAADWLGAVSDALGATDPGLVDPDLTMSVAGLIRFAGKNRSGLDAGRLLGCLDLLARIGNQAESLASVVAEEAQRKGAAAKAEGLDVESHLKLASSIPAAQAKRLLEQGRAWRPFDVVRRAAETGVMAPAQAGAVAKELRDFPTDVLGDRALREAEAELVDEAARLGARALAAKARKLVDSARRQAGVGGGRRDRLNLDREKAHKERFLSFRRDGQAMVINGRCPVEEGIRIKRRLEGAALAARRERTDPRNGGSRDNAAGGLWDPTAGGAEGPEPFGASLMDALVAVTDSYPEGGAPLKAGRPARVVVTMTKDQVGSPAPTGVLEETGEELAPEALNQLLCGAEWIGVLVGSFGEPLDVGRTTRGIPPAIRTALSQRDGGCIFPGCGMGPEGCEAHHLRKWVLGGNTSLTNLVSVCHRHHRILEPAIKLPDGSPWFPGCDDPTRWRAEIDPVHHHPVVIPPDRVDSERKPMLNDRIRIRLEASGAIAKGARNSRLRETPDQGPRARENSAPVTATATEAAIATAGAGAR
ncbi:MAG: HNH endonuclease [Bifidobacteriaceae bacterium]|nr:HNH endonuclease [Bifidobacteriaceae bacterium]